MAKVEKLTERYEMMVDDMMRRAVKQGRINDEETEYSLTRTDVKRLKNITWPKKVKRGVIELQGDKLVVIPKGSGEKAEVEKEVTPIPTPSPEPEKAKAVEPEPTTSGSEGSPEPEKAKSKRQEPDYAEDYLMWVGYQGYPTIEDFINEAGRLGVSKRISRLPKGLVPGESRVFLAHDEGIKGDAVIFGYFVVERAEVIVEDLASLDPDLRDILSPVLLADAIKEPERGCGYRDTPGAMYLTCSDMSLFRKASEEAQEYTLHGGLVIFKDLRDYNLLINEEGKRFRSFRKADGDLIMQADCYKTSPLERAERTINISQDNLPKAKAKWTAEEHDALRGLVEKHGKLYPAFKEFARQTNRTLRSVEYQWFKKLAKADAEPKVDTKVATDEAYTKMKEAQPKPVEHDDGVVDAILTEEVS